LFLARIVTGYETDPSLHPETREETITIGSWKDHGHSVLGFEGKFACKLYATHEDITGDAAVLHDLTL
jgi:hypothetical protein